MQTRAPERLSALQKRFADHIRDPDNAPPPEGLEDRRLAIYRRLFFNNLRNLLAVQFPTVRGIYSDREWESMIRDFMVHHRPKTPLFPELPNEFLRYLNETRDKADDPPFLLELAHFEWLKRTLRLDEQDIADAVCDADGDVAEGIPVLSPLARLANYRFPVHLVDRNNQPETAPDQATLLLVYRNRRDRTGFLKLNPVSARLFQLLNENRGRTGLQLLAQIARELRHPEPAQVETHGRTVLEDFRGRDILLGTRIKS